MTTLAPGDMHNDHHDDSWMRKAVSESNRLARHWVGRYVENASARGDQHHDHHQDNWYRQEMAEIEAESPLTSSVSVATPMQALSHLTRQYTPVTEADRKAMFVLAQFVTGMDCWSETHYQAHLRRNRLSAHEARVNHPGNPRYRDGRVVMDEPPAPSMVQAFMDSARG